MPSYDGYNIFGRAVRMATSVMAPATQRNNFFGLNNTENLAGGFRGRVTTVQGLLYGATSTDLSDQEVVFGSYADGLGRDLVDMYGRTWNDVVLDSFEPTGKPMQDGSGWYRTYRATFLHGS